MPPTPPTRLDRYLAHRRAWDATLWIAYFAVEAFFNGVVVDMQFAREHADVARWKPFVWEFSSVALLVALLPALAWLLRRFPLGFATWRRNLPLHLLASVAYSLIHVAGMVMLRAGAYAIAGDDYRFGDWPLELAYEYLKDVRTYFLCVGVIVGNQFIVRRLQGEASLLEAPDDGAPVEPIERPDRFLVRKLGKEFLVAAIDIEWLEAEGNYVNLHVKGRLYPLRSTMTAIEPRLDPLRFLRVHRSYIVNLEHLVEIEPLDTGDARLKLRDGTVVPCSRRYRAALRARGGQEGVTAS